MNPLSLFLATLAVGFVMGAVTVLLWAMAGDIEADGYVIRNASAWAVIQRLNDRLARYRAWLLVLFAIAAVLAAIECYRWWS